MLVSLYYLTLWYPLPKLQPKGKTKEPKDDIHDSERGHFFAPPLPRPSPPKKNGVENWGAKNRLHEYAANRAVK